MKIVVLCLCVMAACSSCAASDSLKPSAGERAVPVSSRLIKEGWRLTSAVDPLKPVTGHALYARGGSAEIRVVDRASFRQIVAGIASREDALEYVRLMESPELRPFLRDVLCGEVHRKAGDADRWFAVEAARWDSLGLRPPAVTEEQGRYRIERFVACNPRVEAGNRLTPARLARVVEWVDGAGSYAAEVKETLAEGEEIHRLLPIAK